MLKYLAIILIYFSSSQLIVAQSSNFDVAFNQAQQNLELGKYKQVVNQTNALIKSRLTKKQKAKTLILKSYAQSKLKSYKSLLKTYKQIYQLLPETKYAEKLIACYIKLDNLVLANKYVDKLLQKDPYNAELVYLKAGLLLLDKEYEKTFLLLVKFKRNNPQHRDARLYYNLGFCKYNMNKSNPGEAVTSFKRAIRLNPQLYDAYLELGKIYFGFHDYKSAIEVLLKYLEPVMNKNPQDFSSNDYDAFMFIGLSYFYVNNDDMAVKYLSKVASKNEHAKYFRAISNYFLAKKSKKKNLLREAEKDLDILKDKLESPYVLYTMALIAIEHKDEDEAEDLIETLIEEFPYFEKVINLKVKMLIYDEEYDEAEELILTYLKEHKDTKDLYLSIKLAEIYLFDNENKKAIELLTNLVDRYPKTPRLFLLLSRAHRIEKNHEKSLFYLDKVLKVDKYNEEALVNKSALNLGYGNSSDAIDDLTFVLKHINSKNIEAYLLRAKAYLLAHNKFKACFDLDKADVYATAKDDRKKMREIRKLIQLNCED